MDINQYSFTKARPVWEEGKEREYNYTLDFVAQIKGDTPSATLSLALSTSYILLINGNFVVHGPARAPHGYYRVDEIPISEHLTEDQNTVAIRVAGYNSNCFSYIEAPSFLCAEIKSGEKVLAYTAESCDDFKAYPLKERVRCVSRYSFQREFAEHYSLPERSFAAERGIPADAPCRLSEAETKQFLFREAPYPEFSRLPAKRIVQCGRIDLSANDRYPNFRLCMRADPLVHPDDPIIHGFDKTEIEYTPHETVKKINIVTKEASCDAPSRIHVSENGYADIDMGKNYTGLFEFELEAERSGEMLIIFDEIMQNGEVNGFRCGSANVIGIKFAKGVHKFVSAEAYTFKFARAVALGSTVTLKHFGLIEYAFPKSLIKKKLDTSKCDSGDIADIFDAAVETFAANTLDIFMDCPGRERGGWLCDSFFTARAEYALTGHSMVERIFLSNFLYPEKFDNIPSGMLPMCYPADHTKGMFIPNWAMWYAVELREYVARTSDTALKDDAREKMYSLLTYFRQFENEYGLLEKLENWVFIEWSKANDFVQDVSFPSNMLYSMFKSALAEMYGDSALSAEATSLRETIKSLSMTDSGFFCDNANRVNGKLVLSGERSEACQYYAFYSGVATPESHPWLWNTLVADFGYQRKATGKYPEIYEANSFIGNYLRLDLLEKYGYCDILLDSIKGYFGYMAKETGTLWEHTAPTASCNHGFASHVAYWLDRLGLLTDK